MSYIVIYSNSDSTGLAVNPADPANPADSTNSVSLALLTALVLHSLDLGSAAYLLLTYISYFPVLLFLDETVLAFLTCLAVLHILHMPIKTQVRL